MAKIFQRGLLFWMPIVLIATLIPVATQVSAQTSIPGGNVSGTWRAAGSPYLVDGDITVPAGQTLTIEPGVEVIFQSWYKLTVNGTLLAVGTESSPILFTGTHPTAGWLGIRFIDAPDGSELKHVIVEKGRATGASPEDAGGGIYIENASPTISYSTIRDNFAKRNGGGLYLTNSNARLIGNTITNNSAGQGSSAAGGGIFMLNSNPELTGNVISGNQVIATSGFTPSTGSGGGVFARSSDPVLSYNVISGNSVSAAYARGGGIYLYYADPDIINTTITGNTVGESTGGYYSANEGGGIFLYQSDATIVNSILWNDTAEEIFVSSSGVARTITVAFSDLQGGQAAIVTNDNATLNWLQGNIDADPLFVDPASSDYQLQAGSSAIDASAAFFQWQGETLVDLSPGEYIGAAPDMGALEYGDAGAGNQPPVAVAAANPDHGSAPLTVQFSSDGSYDPDGTIAAQAWDFGDGGSASEANPTYTFSDVGSYQVTLTVTDDDGASHSVVLTVNVVDGTTIWGGDVSGAWTAAGSPYRIEGDITVPAGQTLTIEPGVEVIFQSWYKLTVNGTLLAVGTESNPILFTGTHPTAGWLGIRFIDAPDGSELTHVIVEKGRATGASPEDAGGGIYIENANPTISYSTIRDNFAKRAGGGIYLSSSNASLIGNTILNNSAGQGASASGGGIYLLNANAELTGNLIRGNWVYVSGSYTTPSGLGGGIFARSSNPTLRDNVISDNYVEGHLNSNARGGGLYLYYADADIINTTITGNTVGESTGGSYSPKEGGGLYLYQSDPTIVNSILWNDTPEEIFVSTNGLASTITLAYSDVQGGVAGILTNGNAVVNWLQGNIAADPRFVDPAAGNHQLQADSPAIDAGTDFFQWQGQTLVDLSPGEYSGAAPDMGAFEYDGPVGQNLPPVAVASAVPASGVAPLAVQFSAAGSYDPDGTITAYAWDFGDGATSSQADPAHTYANPGTYSATLTVTDDAGATAGDVVVITVTAATQNELHVQDQVVTREKIRRNVRGVDTVLIFDQDGQPVAGTTVTVVYYGPNSGQVSGITGADGTVVLKTSWVRQPRGTWCFEVTDVSKDGYTYNPNANVVTVQCESN